MQQKNVHWFPGHMVKAMRQIEERLKVIDIIIEVVDARAPISSKNPFLEKITQNKKRLIVFSKKDLCDKDAVLPFLDYYKNLNYSAVVCDLNKPQDVKLLVQKAFELGNLYHDIGDYENARIYLNEALKITEKNTNYINEELAWNGTIYDLLAISEFYTEHYKEALDNAVLASSISTLI